LAIEKCNDNCHDGCGAKIKEMEVETYALAMKNGGELPWLLVREVED